MGLYFWCRFPAVRSHGLEREWRMSAVASAPSIARSETSEVTIASRPARTVMDRIPEFGPRPTTPNCDATLETVDGSLPERGAIHGGKLPWRLSFPAFLDRMEIEKSGIGPAKVAIARKRIRPVAAVARISNVWTTTEMMSVGIPDERRVA